MRTKTKRNDPCPCGSGKKHKKCCGQGQRAGALPPVRTNQRRFGIPILGATERDGMRAAGKANATLLDLVRDRVAPGVTLEAIDDFVRTWTYDQGYLPACLGYRGFPKSCCTSVNEVVCHGIPSDYALREGDIVNIDLTTIVEGWYGDQSETFLIGEVSPPARGVTQCAFDALYAAIDAISPGSRIAEIGEAIVKLAHGRGYSVVEDFQGHGIGRKFHTDPGIPHYPEARWGHVVLEPGMCFTIEPMINVGGKRSSIDKQDGWTARTNDGSLSAQFEHTLLMTETGIEILTKTERGPLPDHRF